MDLGAIRAELAACYDLAPSLAAADATADIYAKTARVIPLADWARHGLPPGVRGGDLLAVTDGPDGVTLHLLPEETAARRRAAQALFEGQEEVRPEAFAQREHLGRHRGPAGDRRPAAEHAAAGGAAGAVEFALAERERIEPQAARQLLGHTAAGAAEQARRRRIPLVVINRGVTKGILHANTVSRKMSRLAARVKALATPAA